LRKSSVSNAELNLAVAKNYLEWKVNGKKVEQSPIKPRRMNVLAVSKLQ